MKHILFLILVVSFLVGCAAGLPKSGTAVVVTTQQAEYAGNAKTAPKRGQACVQNILGLVATGDASVETAKRNGGIKSVATIDRDVFGLTLYIPIYAKSCTIITGS